MCMITFLPEGQMPDSVAIYNGTIYNDDGHGFAMIGNDGELIVRRGFDGAHMVELFCELRALHPSGPAMFHSRMATHGVTDKSNVHPFYVGGDRRTVLVHNGIFANLPVIKGQEWSDTRIFAQAFLPSKPKMNVLTHGGRKKTERWMGRWNKVAVITVNPRSRVSSFILNESEGYWDDGVWYSSTDYLGVKYAGRYYSGGTTISRDADWFSEGFGFRGKNDDDRWDEYWTEYVAERKVCKFCEAIGSIDLKTAECAVCTMCNDCEQPAKFCACF